MSEYEAGCLRPAPGVEVCELDVGHDSALSSVIPVLSGQKEGRNISVRTLYTSIEIWIK